MWWQCGWLSAGNVAADRLKRVGSPARFFIVDNYVDFYSRYEILPEDGHELIRSWGIEMRTASQAAIVGVTVVCVMGSVCAAMGPVERAYLQKVVRFTEPQKHERVFADMWTDRRLPPRSVMMGSAQTFWPYSGWFDEMEDGKDKKK